MKKIAVDVDGVLSNFVRGFNAIIDELWPGRLSSDFVQSSWNWEDCTDLTKAEISQVWDRLKGLAYFWQALPGYNDNVEAMREFLDETRDVDVIYLTSRMDTGGRSALRQTEEWLWKHGISRPNTIVVPVSGADKKRAFVELFEIKAIIDDYLPTVVSMGSITEAYLLDRPWNQSDRVGEIKVVGSLGEFLAAV